MPLISIKKLQSRGIETKIRGRISTTKTRTEREHYFEFEVK